MNPDHSARAWARETIQAVGLRATPARVATLLILRDSSSPLSHAEVSHRLAEHHIDRATVFRNLGDMVSAEIVRRTELGDHVWRFELIRDDADGDQTQPQFVCIDCGSIARIRDFELTDESKAAAARIGEITEVLLRGHCPDCI